MSLECAITTLHLVLQTLALEQIWKANGHNGKAISWSQISQWVTLQVSKIGSLAWSWNSTNTFPNLCPLVQCSRNFVDFHGIQGAGMHQINFLVCTHSTVGNVFQNCQSFTFHQFISIQLVPGSNFSDKRCGLSVIYHKWHSRCFVLFWNSCY